MTTGVNHITFAVSDLRRALRFYVEVIGCSKVATWGKGAYLRAGETGLCLSLDPAACRTGTLQRRLKHISAARNTASSTGSIIARHAMRRARRA